jgi:acyl transferase domain-containing protein/acyl carrier protein
MDGFAIVGMACRFPEASNLKAFETLCWHKIDAITEVPKERWDIDAIFDTNLSAPGKTYSRWGGFLKDLEQFDARFFGISPREAAHVDPRQRLILETSWEALEDAGIPPLSLAGSKTGVFVSTLADDYGQFIFSDTHRVESYSGTGTAHSIIANRLSYFYDFHGPSLTLDTACSGSLVALHLATQSLQRQETNLVLVGGVNVILTPNSTIFFSRAGALSKTGRCKAFSADADGFVRSEGAGIIVIKRLDDAIRSGDRIYAVIRGSAVNQDGKTSGIMAPNVEAQKQVLYAAYQNAQINPAEVQYIETHGTGTPLGDAVEITALGAVLQEGRTADSHCLIGSIKTLIGHTEAAAGIASVIKTALAIFKRSIPGNLHYQGSRANSAFENLPLSVVEDASDWPCPESLLIAGVSGFGFGGTNAHVILTAAPESIGPAVEALSLPVPFYLSAQSPEALRQLGQRYLELIVQDHIAIEELARASCCLRSHLKYRLAMILQDRDQAVALLKQFVDVGHEPNLMIGSKLPQAKKLAFVFSGQGTHWLGMGKSLFSHPVFSKTMHLCDQYIREEADFSLLEEMRRPEESSRLHFSSIAQLAIFSIQASLTMLLRSLNVIPDVVVGQSLGEVAAAYAAGIFSLKDACSIVYHRGRLMQQMQGRGKTAQINLSYNEVLELIKPWGSQLCVAGCSSPSATIIAGEPGAIGCVIEKMENQEIFARTLQEIDIAFHSAQMDELQQPLIDALHQIEPQRASIPFFSSVDVRLVNGKDVDAAYWAKNLRQPFYMDQAIQALLQEDVTDFIEISPHAVLSNAIREVAKKNNQACFIASTLKRHMDSLRNVLETCGQLYVNGYVPEWFTVDKKLLNTLPLYPWERNRYWLQTATASSLKVSHDHPWLGEYIPLPSRSLHIWETDITSGDPTFLADHQVFNKKIFPGAGYIEIAVAGAMKLGYQRRLTLKNINFLKVLILSSDEASRIQVVFSEDSSHRINFDIHTRKVLDALVDSASIITHTTGEITANISDGTMSEYREVNILQTQCTVAVTSESFYQKLAQQGLQYGESFQLLKAIYLGEQEAFARIECVQGIEADWKKYQLHPLIMDALFQLSAAVIQPHNTQARFIPLGMKALHIYHPLESRVYGHARLKQYSPNQDRAYVDLELMNTDGLLIAKVEELELGTIDETALQQPSKISSAQWIYQLQWRPESFSTHSVEKTTIVHSWVIFGRGDGLADTCCHVLQEQGYQVVQVVEGEGFNEIKAGELYAVNPIDKQDYQHLFATLKIQEPYGIISLWALDSNHNEIIVNTQACVSRTVSLIQAMGEQVFQLKLYIVTRGANAIDSIINEYGLGQAAIWGLGRVALHEEYPSFCGGLIDLDPASCDRVHEAQQIYYEWLAVDGPDQVAYRKGLQYKLQLERMASPVQAPFTASNDRAYLISGGFGDLGKTVALYLAAHGARHLVLMSRRVLPMRQEGQHIQNDHPDYADLQFVTRLEQYGCRVEIATLDVSDLNALERYARYRKDQALLPIDTIFHTVGLMHDTRLAAATPDDIQRVFAGKVCGALHLWQTFSTPDLQSMVLFSSLAAILPPIGQGIYAASNAFLDMFAYYLRARGVKALSINWGPMETAIMEQSKMREFYRQRGTEVMNTSTCIAVLFNLMQQDLSHVIIADINWSLFDKFKVHKPEMVKKLISSTSLVENKPQSLQQFLDELLASNEEEKNRLLTEKIQSILQLTLGIEPHQIDLCQPLMSYGLDSMMALEFRNRIELATKIMISPLDILKGLTLNELVIQGIEQLKQLPTSPEPLSEEIAALLEALDEIEGMTQQEVEMALEVDEVYD